MFSQEELHRYNRHFLLEGFGREGQEKLKQAKVLVIGAGGLGCPVLLYLSAAGVGEIGIVDDDVVDESNLHRQVLYTAAEAGEPKAEVAAKKLREQNPFVKFNVHASRLDNQNALELFTIYDVIVDGTDNFATRYLVNDACVILNKPLVYGAISRFEGQVAVFNLQGRGSTYRCLFPVPPQPGTVPSCEEAGVLGVLPGIIGTLQASEAIKIITGIGEPLSGRLLIVDALGMHFTTLEIERNEAWKNSAPLTAEAFQKTDYAFLCGSKMPGNRISAAALRRLMNEQPGLQLLDVREPGELPDPGLKALKIPLGDLEKLYHKIPRDHKVVVYCRSGMRSQRAIALLENKFGFTNLYNLEGGIMQWQQS